MPETKFEATNHLGSCRSGSLTFRNSSLTLLPPAACSHFLRLLSLLPSYASPGGAVCVTQMMCLCPTWILEALFISFSQLMFVFCCGCCFHPKPFERFAVMNSWDLVVRCPSFFMSLPLLHSTRSCFPLVGTWPDQSASTIKKDVANANSYSSRFSNRQHHTALAEGIQSIHLECGAQSPSKFFVIGFLPS